MAELGYRHYAGLKGTNIKTVGPDVDVYQYTNLETCLAASQANDVIIIDQGTYALTATNTINYNLTVVGRGKVTVTGGTAGLADRMFMLNKPPATSTANTFIKFENINFSNAADNADIFEIDNDGGGTGDMDVTFFRCSFDASSTGGIAIDCDQTTNSINLYVRVVGSDTKLLDSCNIALTKAASSFSVSGYDMSATASVFTLGTGAVASYYTWENCKFGSAAITSGGNAAIKQNFIACSNVTAGSVRELALSDIDAAGVINIIGATYQTPATQVVGTSGTRNYSVTSLATAVAAASAGDTIYLEPGTHTIVTDTTLAINKNITIEGRGRCIVSGAVATTMITINKPAGAGTTATYVTLKNIDFQNTTDAAHCISINNNGGSTGALYINLIDCSFAVTGAGLGISLLQTTATEHIYLYIKGDCRKDKPFVTTNMAFKLAASEVVFDGIDFGNSVHTLGTDNVANVVLLKNCLYQSDALFTGGSASLKFNAWNCVRAQASVIQIPVANDFDQTCAGEPIIPAS